MTQLHALINTFFFSENDIFAFSFSFLKILDYFIVNYDLEKNIYVKKYAQVKITNIR